MAFPFLPLIDPFFLTGVPRMGIKPIQPYYKRCFREYLAYDNLLQFITKPLHLAFVVPVCSPILKEQKKQTLNMKTKIMTLMIVALSCFAINANAQSAEESRVKIIPTITPGIIKLIHAVPSEEAISITFYNDRDMIGSDKVEGSFPNGLLKCYDLRKISDKQFYMEVRSEGMTVTYRITASSDRKKHTPFLEQVVYHDKVVASRN
jgi:hypothetical protein